MTTSRKKILFLIESLAGGGAEKILSVLALRLEKGKFDVTVMTVVDTGIHAEQVRQVVNYHSLLGVPPVTLLARIWYWCRYKLVYSLPPSWIHRVFIREHYDVEVAFIEGFSTKLIAASPNPHSRKLAWVHTDLCGNHWTNTVFRNLRQETSAYGQFDRIACVSRQVKEGLATLFGVKESAVVLYNPIDSQEIRRLATEAMGEPHSMPCRLRLVSTGRLTEQKGYDRLLEIHRRLLFDGLDHELWILGEGPQRSQLEAYIRQHHLESSVQLLGFQANPYTYLRQCDFFVCSSRVEGFSTAVTEALILGLPVITTDCSGMKELLGSNNEFGIVTENDKAALCEGLRSMLANPELLAHYRRQAAIRGEVFDFEQSMTAIADLLEETT